MLIVSIVAFASALSVLIIVHEFGHFILAKKAGIDVERFSIGFGPRLFGWKWWGTDFCVSLLPLGGYVKMQGEEGEKEVSHIPGSFSNKTVWQRIQVAAAGPLMNLLFAFFLLPVVFLLGRNVPTFLKEAPVVQSILPGSAAAAAHLMTGDELKMIGDTPISNWEEAMRTIPIFSNQDVILKVMRGGVVQEIPVHLGAFGERDGTLGVEPPVATPQEVMLTQVQSASPAEKAGFLRGDKVISIGNVALLNWEHLRQIVQESDGKELSFTIQRESARKTLSVVADFDKGAKQWLIGVQSAPVSFPMTMQHYSFVEAVRKGWQEAAQLVNLTFVVLKKLVTLQLSYKMLGGPVQIAYSLAQASSSGFSDFLYFVGFLSIQLGILNLLPIPVLDGGMLFFLLAEGLLRKPIPFRVRLVAQQIGMGALLILILLITFNDLHRLLGK